MNLVVQETSIKWSKASRGGAGATQRNAIPESFPLMNIPPISYPHCLIHQRIEVSESGGFKIPKPEVTIQELRVGEVLTFACVELQVELEQVAVIYTYSQTCVGAPDRVPYPKKVLLTNNLWLRVTYNGRFSSWESNWSYRKMTLNIGLFDHISRGVFLSEPRQVIRDIAKLR